MANLIETTGTDNSATITARPTEPNQKVRPRHSSTACQISLSYVDHLPDFFRSRVCIYITFNAMHFGKTFLANISSLVNWRQTTLMDKMFNTLISIHWHHSYCPTIIVARVIPPETVTASGRISRWPKWPDGGKQCPTLLWTHIFRYLPIPMSAGHPNGGRCSV